MFTKTTAESLAAERAELEHIQRKRDELLEAAQRKRAEHADQRSLFERLSSSEGILEATDADLAREEARLKECSRDALRADAELRKFAHGEGANLEPRLRDLTEREKEFRFGVARKALRKTLSEHLAALRKLSAAEAELDKMAVAAGYTRGPVHILSSTARGERNTLDVWKYDLLGYGLDLLEPTDPQRRIFENEHAVRTAA